MYPESIKNNAANIRKKVNKFLFNLVAARPYSAIIFLGLLCTLTVKLFYSIKSSMLSQYPGWVLSDITFFLGVEVILAFVCFWRPHKWVIRLATIFAAVVCWWSFLNAGYLIRTGTQILPRVLLPVVRDPINALHMVGRNLCQMPLTSVIILMPGAIALSFFFYIVAKPKMPGYKQKSFFVRFNISIVICLLAVSMRPVLVRGRSPQAISLELQYNAQAKAVKNLLFSRHKPPQEPTRKFPFHDQLKLTAENDIQKKNIVLVVLEGVQRRQTSLADDSNDLTPFLAGFADQGVEFTNTRSSLTHTTKALFALLTGRYASASQDVVEAVPTEKAYASIAMALKDKLGYRTAFFQSAKGDFECRPGLAYNLGFDQFFSRDDLNDPNSFVSYLGCDENAMIKPVTEWLESDDKPFFLTYMCSVTHDEYKVPDWYGQQPKEIIDRYRQTIAYTDMFLSTFYKELTEEGFMDNTIFCVIGDHGEAFNEHGKSGHERIVFEECLHVPFCIRAPSLIEPGTVITDPVSSIDLTPTLLGLLGFNTDKADFDGENVLNGVDDTRKLFFTSWMYESQIGYVQDEYKYIYDPMLDIACYYNLKDDPYEMVSMEIPEEKREAFINEMQTWRENTILHFDEDYKGKKTLFDRWLCRWNSRIPSVKYLTIEARREYALRN